MDKAGQNAFVRGLFAVMEAEGWKMKPLSEAAGLNESAVRDLARNASAPKVTSAHALATVLGRTVDELIAIGEQDAPDPHTGRVIAVAGRVGAGAKVSLADDHAKGDGLFQIACPPQLSPSGIVAVEIVGDSMEDAARHIKKGMGVFPHICVDVGKNPHYRAFIRSPMEVTMITSKIPPLVPIPAAAQDPALVRATRRALVVRPDTPMLDAIDRATAWGVLLREVRQRRRPATAQTPQDAA